MNKKKRSNSRSRNDAAQQKVFDELVKNHPLIKELDARIKAKPLRISPAVKRILKNPKDAIEAIEYFKLCEEYKQLTGKNFRRYARDIHNKHTKLQAIKIRIKQIHDREDLKSVMADLRKKNGPDFNLLGAL